MANGNATPARMSDNRGVKKQIIGTPGAPLEDWWDLDNRVGEVAVTSEDASHPVEAALTGGAEWRASTPGKQTIRLTFREPQHLHRIYLRFVENEQERTQEFGLRWSADGGKSFRDLFRQQWNFSPQGATEEVEDYHVNLDNVGILELTIDPGRSAVASLADWKLA
jgi:hypothetical protein